MANLKELGIALKAYRVAADESTGQLADAVESDEKYIKQIESGLTAPNIELLELLARHYSLREQEAKRLMELAGHKTDDFELRLDSGDLSLDKLTKDFDVLMSPVFYSDMVNVVSNKYGLTINFVQDSGNGEKPIVIARVGMSHEHAKSIIRVLEQSLKQAKKKLSEDGELN